LYIALSKENDIPPNSKIINVMDCRFSCQSSTHLAFLNALGSLDKVVGLCGMQYIRNPLYKLILNENDAGEICAGEKTDMEALIGTNSSLFLTYPFAIDEGSKFTKSGIKTLLIAEYLESSQLARLEWIKLFGVITGQAEAANIYFNKVANEYLNIQKDVKKTDQSFIMNVPFGDTWFMPSANSVGVQLIEKAGIDYFYKNEAGTENKIRSKEQVWEDGMESDYWIIIAERPKDFSLKDLIAEEPVYKAFKAVRNQQVIFCNTGTVDYFAEGVVEPNILLKDLRFAIGQLPEHTPKYFFLLE
jgi:iron complex transport system substrate-binding protein